MVKLGETFIDGKIVNLDKAEISDLVNYLQTIQNNKKIQREKLDNFLEEIYS